MAKSQVEGLFTSEDLQELIQVRPSLASELADAVDAKIERLGNVKEALTGFSSGTPTTKRKARKSSGKRVKRGLHGEMAIKILASMGATSNSKGVTSSELKKSKKHDFGSALNATLDGLAAKGIVGYENVSENEKPRYRFWLAMSEDKAIAAAAEAAKAGRKPKKK